MADEVNNLEWIKCQIEIKKLETEKYIEGLRVVHSYSKLLITNLILINAGGIASIPVIAAFVKVDTVSVSQRVDMFKFSAGCFAAGLIFALCCGASAYLNSNFFTAHSDWNISLNVSNLWKAHPRFNDDEVYRSQINELADAASRKAVSYGRWIDATQILGFAFGLISAAFFIVACVKLLYLKLP